MAVYVSIDDFVSNITACGAKKAPAPEVTTPVPFPDMRKLLLYLPRGPALGVLDEFTDGNMRRYLSENMHVID